MILWLRASKLYNLHCKSSVTIRQIQAILLHSAYASRFWSYNQMLRKKKSSKKPRFLIQYRPRICSDHRQLSQIIAIQTHLVLDHWLLPTDNNSSRISKHLLQILMASSYLSKLGAQVICLSKVLIAHLLTVAWTIIKIIYPSASSNFSKPKRPHLIRLVQKLSQATPHQPITCICPSQMEYRHQLPSPQTLCNSSNNNNSHICLVNNNRHSLRIKCSHNFRLLKIWQWCLASSREQKAYKA